MNAKQTISAIAKIAPPLLFGVAIYYGIKWVFSADNSVNNAETPPVNTEEENRRKEMEITVFRPIPAKIPATPTFDSISPVPKLFTPQLSVPFVFQNAGTQAPLPPVQKKFVTRKDLAAVFHQGTQSLNRKAAVTALKNLGFGKTAAYEALSADGRFSAWLQFAPDGIITWAE